MAAFVTGGRPRAGLRACALLAAILAAAPRADAAEAVVTVQLDNRVEIVDLDAGKVVATIPVPGSPAGIALLPDRRTAYVTRPDAPGLGIVDLAARTLTASLPLPGGPLGIACNPRSGAVYVADWYARRVLVLVPGEGGRTAVTLQVRTGTHAQGTAIADQLAQVVRRHRDELPAGACS